MKPPPPAVPPPPPPLAPLPPRRSTKSSTIREKENSDLIATTPPKAPREADPIDELLDESAEFVPSVPPPALPDRLTEFAKYDVLGLLTTGGMAELYLGRESADTAGQRLTVLKILRQNLLDDANFEAMFLREGKVAMQLVHPNVCTTYEFGKWRGHYFIAMEYIDGTTLRKLLQRLARRGKSMPVPLVLRIISRIAAALDYAHKARTSRGERMGVVHRDVSPQNIMVRYDGVVKLLDFGVAKVQLTEEETRSTSIKGKFGYLSPEQCTARPVDARSDVFALGVVLFETLTGRRLFKRESEYETLKAILEETVPSVKEQFPEHGEAIDAIIHKALAKKPRDRFQTAGEMQEAMEEVLGQFRLTAARHVAEFVRPLFEEEIAAGPQLTSDETVVRRLRPATSLRPASTPPASTRNRNIVIGVVATMVVVAAFLIGSMWSGSSDAEAPVAEVPDLPEAVAEAVEEPDVVEVVEAEPAIESEPVAEADPEEAPDEAEGEEEPPDEVGESDEESAAERRRRRRERRARRNRNMRPGFTSDPGF